MLSILKKLIIPICYRWPDWLRVCAAQDKTRLLHRAGSAGQGQSRDTQRYCHSDIPGTPATSLSQVQRLHSPRYTSLLLSHRYSHFTLPGTASPLSLVQKHIPFSQVQPLHSPRYTSLFHSHRYSSYFPPTGTATPLSQVQQLIPLSQVQQLIPLSQVQPLHYLRNTSLFHSHRYSHSTLSGTQA